ncbi:MAG: cellulase family glycosylhydrolase [Anaerocolumna sp.]
MKLRKVFQSKLRVLLSFILFFCIMAANAVCGNGIIAKAAAGLTAEDFLKTDGTSIRKANGSGDTVNLRGTNAGGWLVQESWMNPTNAGDQKTMMNTFKNRFGESVRDQLIAVYEDNYWTTQDFDNCADMGMSVIRLPFTYMNLADDNGNLKADAFKRLDWFVDNCSQRGMYVILDMHGTFGSQNGMDHSGEVNDGYQLYWNTANRENTLKLWEKTAEHFKGNPAVAAYDLLNEPGIKAGATGSVQWDFYNEIYKRIRTVDPDHIIMMESCWNAGNLPRPDAYGWTNIVYEYHYYAWDFVDSVSGQASFIAGKVTDINSHNYGVPTFIGEFTCFGLEDAWKNALSTFNREGWHWTSWTYKVTGTSSWGIYNHNPQKVDIYNDSQDTIRQKWSAVGTQNGYVNSKIYNVIKTYLTETVTPVSLSDGQYYITSIANGKVVCAENAGADPLVANRDLGAGAWEAFGLKNNSDGTVSFLSAANNKYICAVIDEENQLLARSAAIDTWEKFQLVSLGNGVYGIKAIANGKYVKANLDNNARLEAANDTVAGAWEAFRFTKVN